jgi:hypothetical protein
MLEGKGGCLFHGMTPEVQFRGKSRLEAKDKEVSAAHQQDSLIYDNVHTVLKGYLYYDKGMAGRTNRKDEIRQN